MEQKQALHKKMRSHRRTASENLDDICFKSESTKGNHIQKQSNHPSKPKAKHERNYTTHMETNPDEHQVVKLLKVANQSQRQKQIIVDSINQTYDSSTKQDNYPSNCFSKDPYLIRDRFIDEPGILDFSNFMEKPQRGIYSNMNSERSKRISRKNIFAREKTQNPTINQYSQFQHFVKLRKTNTIKANFFSMEERIATKQ